MRYGVVALLLLGAALHADIATYKFRVNTNPKDAKIVMTSIKPVYQDGMQLPANIYRLKISKKGYQSKYGLVDLRSDHNISVKLQAIGTTPLTFRKVTAFYWKQAIWSGKRSYENNSPHTVRDKLTNLIWQKRASKDPMNHYYASKYCKDLIIDSYDDWRLPTYKELYYLADRKYYAPAINRNYFQEKGHWYWSSTEHAKYKNQFWYVRFDEGSDLYDDKSRVNHARCVR